MQRSTTETLDTSDASSLESCLGTVMAVAAFAVAASVCSGIFTLASMP